MFGWFTKLFSSSATEPAALSEEEKKRSSDDVMTQTLIFPTANNALHPNGSTDSSDAGSSDGGGSAGD